ncbi:SAM-dependent methyltransferase [Perlucidibaca piscinae]|uniref:SAM-dependent methyltransferase n=1 Tax=Perlucidibaca piscinae TaxID=392589 RepID=UPI0003B5EA3B|nr:cyclopropane-fatty-acyl-phospholipid synthase family protein [Perlucidibaca piscinae]
MNLSENTRIEIARAPAMARLLMNLLQRIEVGSLQLTLPSGSTLHAGGHTPGPDAALEIRDWSACGQILRSGDIGLAEAYRDRKLEIPDIPAFLLLAMANEAALEQAFYGSFWGTLLYKLKHFVGNRNTRKGSKKNIHAHYDLGNDFYRLWLDRTMTYSSALFSHPGQDLAEAQTAKYERLLDRLGVKAGDHILEIGCGWGGFAEHAASTRGVRVTGISLSREQLAWARERVRGTAIESLCEFRFQDYRDVRGQYDAIASIEMIEAVGESYWPSYFGQLHDLLKPGGRAGIQAILIADSRFDDYRRKTDFIQQYIFPGGMLLSPTRLRQCGETAGLQLQDMHCFGPDYAETLRRWRDGFEAHLTRIGEQGFDEAFQRIWRFYYGYCEAGFDAARTDVCQAVFTRPA